MAARKGAGSMVLFLAAWAVNLAFDGLALVSPRLGPPHLLHDHMPEAIRGMVSPLVLAPVTSAVLAAIALLVLSLVPPGAPHRVRRLATWMAGFWLLSEGLLAWVWLDAPAATVIASLAAGLLRCVALAWVLDRLGPPGREAR